MRWGRVTDPCPYCGCKQGLAYLRVGWLSLQVGRFWHTPSCMMAHQNGPWFNLRISGSEDRPGTVRKRA